MQCSNELFCFLLCRIWDDHPCDHSWEDFLDLLRSSGLCGHHPVLQPLSGAHHYPAGRGDEGCVCASADQRPPPARDLPGLRGEYVARLETLGVHVMLILGLSSIVISCCASAMYTPIEGWTYLDSLYFCFVTFSTIGFGDLVSSQNAAYGYQGLYRLANFFFILTGVCCIYSLFNVISIVIKQVLNWMLGKMSCVCCQRCSKANAFLGRRNAIRPGSRLRRGRFARTPDSDGPCDSDTEGRRLSGEMISMRDLTGSNKISLAIMQKQLSESANGYPRTVCGSSRQNGFSGGVGALGIMNNRLAETSDSR